MTAARLARIQRSRAPLLVVLGVIVFQLHLAGCTERVEDSAAYKAACHGPPLHGDTMRRNSAFEAGYAINPFYDCIDKTSFIQMNEEKARLEAANTPEGRALQQAEQQRLMAEQKARAVAAKASVEEQPSPLPAPPVVQVDVNTGTEVELAGIPPLDLATAAQIAEQRGLRPFSDWADLVSRITGLGAAQTAAYASTAGLTVNGQSLPGAPPNAEMAAQLRARYQGNR